MSVFNLRSTFPLTNFYIVSAHDVQRTSEAPTGLLNGTDALPVEQWTRCCEFVAEGSDAIKVKEDLHALSLTSSLLRDIAQLDSASRPHHNNYYENAPRGF